MGSLTAPSAIASRRSVPQLPPIQTTSFSNSLLDTSPNQLELMTRSNQIEITGTRVVHTSYDSGPTPLPTPAHIPTSTPPSVPRRASSITKKPHIHASKSSIFEPTDLSAADLKPATRQTKLRKSKSASLFNLFSRPKIEKSRGHNEQGLTSNVLISPVKSPAPADLCTSPTATKNKKQAKDKAVKSVKAPKGLTVQDVPPQRPTTADPKSRASSKPRRKNEDAYNDSCSYQQSSWKLPPLFQAYPQSIKHATLEAMSTNDSFSRVKIHNVIPGDNSSTSSQERPASSRKERQHSASSAGSAEARKTYVLVTAGYLLQYSADGAYDRLPEKVLKLTPASAAFASDLIQGKHWVLQVVENLEDLSAKSVMSQKSLLSKFTFHASAGKSFSTLLLIFDNPSEMDSWMSTVRREIEILAGRTQKHSNIDPKSKHMMPEGGIPLRRYQSITKPKMLDVSPLSSPVRSHPTSPTLFQPPSPGVPNPVSPTFLKSARGSQSTTLVGTGSEWSSTRSSRQYTSTRPSESSPFRFSQIQESPTGDHHSGPSIYLPILEFPGPSSPVREIFVSDTDAEALQSQYMSAPTSAATARHMHSTPSSPLKAEMLVDTGSGSGRIGDTLSPVDDAVEQENDIYLSVGEVSGGTSPLPSPMLNSFPQPNTGPSTSSQLPRSPSGRSPLGSSILTSQKAPTSENTPYFRQRLPDPHTIVEEEEDIVPAVGFSASASKECGHLSHVSSSFLNYQRSLLKHPGFNSEPSSATTLPGAPVPLPGTPQARRTTLDALIGELTSPSPETSPGSESLVKGTRRTSIMRSSTAPLPLRSSALIAKSLPPEPLGLFPDAPKDTTLHQALPLRRPPSMLVKRDQAPFATSFRGNTPSWEPTPSSRPSSSIGDLQSSRSSSITRISGSNRNSVLVPVLRPPSLRASARTSKVFTFGPPQPPPKAPLPQPPQLNV